MCAPRVPPPHEQMFGRGAVVCYSFTRDGDRVFLPFYLSPFHLLFMRYKLLTVAESGYDNNPVLLSKHGVNVFVI